ncbi:MAG: sodium-translocating pyrophosphatase [Ancrocorticia sp.]|jgi:K(+)-stimulated pyrophosphate-energized sodium pump|nr:sodium-translocating pyrophosphatase [Ancrocorticia sp.]MCI1895523.1 sodium-translocating pyrophosphatase [Ancrocorticia sp.]MCI1932196.1 sodium-translocating pyrophosphatase [Ancrocorticia sp.]MCI1963556.1 sodium-translocating pyrophosphatase [Ancrocorticia sp.]MCI2002693.1 sodium-translocating pyrophosphatase [Ancrocorticia sp.]
MSTNVVTKSPHRGLLAATVLALPFLLSACSGQSSESTVHGGEATLELPDLSGVTTAIGLSGRSVLYIGLLLCLFGFGFGLMAYTQLKHLPVHKAMLEISELIYQTCKAYLTKQGKFLLVLWSFITVVIVVYYKALVGFTWGRVAIIVGFSLLGMGGSYAVAWFGIRVNTFANSRTAFASLKGKPLPTHQIPLKSGMSIGMVLISLELFMMLIILLFLPPEIGGACFIGFAIGESLGAAALRIAGGIFTKIADIGSDLMKIVFKIDEDDPRNPGVIADCTGDNAGDSVGPSADGFETYGVTGVALVTFILLAVNGGTMQGLLLVWIFGIRAAMLVSSALAYAINFVWVRKRFTGAGEMNYETPLTSLVWLTSILCIGFTFLTTAAILGNGENGLGWKLALIITCGTLAGALIPELVKAFTSTKSRHVRETVKSSREGGASLNILSGIVAGNFSAYWLGITIVGLMAIAFLVSNQGLSDYMVAPAVFAFGLVAFGFLGMGPVTIAVDSYGPVTDNAQSVYELSQIEQVPNVDAEVTKDFGFTPQWDRAKLMLEENDGAGNTFKATAKPVLIGTAVVGSTTMIFSIIIGLTDKLTVNVENLSIMHAPFLLGLILGGAVIFWFSGASMQAVTTGAYRAVSFIKSHIKLDSSSKRASVEDSRKVVEICTQYAQQGMLNIFLAVFFSALAFAFVEPYLMIGYLISIAIFGLFQAIYMANAGGAWDNAKKVVETDLHAKGTPLHDATIVGDTVGDPFKDTSSVALNPIIKFTTLFGMLAVELAVSLADQGMSSLVHVLAAVFFVISAGFVYKSFYGMRIQTEITDEEPQELTNEAAL